MKLLEDDIVNQELVEICLRVREIDATLDFYTNLFDFEVASRREFPEDKFDLIYLNSPVSSVQSVLTSNYNAESLTICDSFCLYGHGSSVHIQLTYNYNAEPSTIGDGFSNLGVTVSDLEKMHDVCIDSAYETGELKGLSGGTPSYFFVTDPDGYRIEVKRKK